MLRAVIARLLRWLNDNRLFGEYIRNWRLGRGIPRRDKIIAICLIWLTIGSSVIWFISLLWVKALLIAVAAAVTAHLLWMPTAASRPRTSESEREREREQQSCDDTIAPS